MIKISIEKLAALQTVSKTRSARSSGGRPCAMTRSCASVRLTAAWRKYNAPGGALRHATWHPGGWEMQGAKTYNAAADLIERNLAAGRSAKTAFIDDGGRCSYAELAERVSRFANLVRRLGIHPEQRILLCLYDTIDFPTAFLGAIKAGVVPVAVNTQLSVDEFAFMLADSRARAVVVSAPVLPVIRSALS